MCGECEVGVWMWDMGSRYTTSERGRSGGELRDLARGVWIMSETCECESQRILKSELIDSQSKYTPKANAQAPLRQP